MEKIPILFMVASVTKSKAPPRPQGPYHFLYKRENCPPTIHHEGGNLECCFSRRPIMPRPQRTLKLLLGLALCAGLGFFWGLTDGRQRISPSTPQASPPPLSKPLSITVSLKGEEFRQGDSPDLLIEIHSQRDPIPRDIASALRLQMAFPGGWDRERALRDADKALIAVSDDGLHMQILVPMDLFEYSGAPTVGISLNRMILDSPGDQELRVVLDQTPGEAQTRPRASSNKVRFTVISDQLETVQSLPSPQKIETLFNS